MSMRTLIELNHDYSDRLTDAEFLAFLRYYLASGSKRDAEALERFGAKVVGLRHHSDKWIVDACADGFPARYLTPCDSDASLAEDAKRLSPEGVAARAEGIAPNPPEAA